MAAGAILTAFFAVSASAAHAQDTTTPAAPPAAEATAPAPTPTAEPAPVPEVVAATPAPAVTKRRTRIRRSTSTASVPRGGSTRIEISIRAQRMRVYRGGALLRTLPVSTGSGRRYCVKGSCGNAVTPRGSFRIYNRIYGWRTSKLGRLYNPLYFRGGFAIHGGNLPGYPASHGCVRISFAAARWLPSVVPNGTPVYIS